MNETDTFKKAKLNPRAVFDVPEEVAEDTSFTLEQKIEILRSWAYDANELSVAEEENMGDGEPAMLDRVLKELNRLGGSHDASKSPAQKQGGAASADAGKEK